MTIALLVLTLLDVDTIVLKEKANVSGRWVRVIDLVDPDHSDPAARLRIADIYLGRAPGEGKTRTVTLDEIRRELERRGVDPASFVWRGDRVDVCSGLPATSEPLSRAIAFEIKRHLMEREAGLRADEVSVRVLQLQPETAAEGVEVVDIKTRGAGYVAQLSNGMKIDVVARILRGMKPAFQVS